MLELCDAVGSWLSFCSWRCWVKLCVSDLKSAGDAGPWQKIMLQMVYALKAKWCCYDLNVSAFISQLGIESSWISHQPVPRRMQKYVNAVFHRRTKATSAPSQGPNYSSVKKHICIIQ